MPGSTLMFKQQLESREVELRHRRDRAEALVGEVGAALAPQHLREAVHQLQGRAGDRQVAGAERAIVTAGGFFFNAQGCTLRVD